VFLVWVGDADVGARQFLVVISHED
jgi:hypothetical protein